MHTIDPETIETLRGRRNGSLRKLAKELGFDPSFAATLSDIMRRKHGNVSAETENRLREALGLKPVYRYPGTVSVTRATVAQNERRLALGASWRDVIEAGLSALGEA